MRDSFVSGDSTWEEVVPSVFGCSDEVGLEEQFVLLSVLRGAEGKVVGIGEDRVLDATDALIDLGQALH